MFSRDCGLQTADFADSGEYEWDQSAGPSN